MGNGGGRLFGCTREEPSGCLDERPEGSRFNPSATTPITHYPVPIPAVSWHCMPFDPRNPLPRNTLRAIRATGPGQASPERLRAAAVGGVVAAVALYALLDDW